MKFFQKDVEYIGDLPVQLYDPKLVQKIKFACRPLRITCFFQYNRRARSMRKMLTHQKENDKLKYGKLLRERKVDTMIEVTESSLSQYVFHQVDEQLTIGDTVY